MSTKEAQTPPGQPLDEAWWTLLDQKGPKRPGLPILAPYEKTRPGYEWFYADACEPELCGGDFKDVGEGFFEVCLWNVWEKKADPADSDEDKRRINQMQQALGALSDNDRYLRVQTACLQRCWWSFPANVDQVMGGIGDGSPHLEAQVSCEPPWAHSVLPVLRREAGLPAEPTDSRHALTRAYVTILTWWLAEGRLKDLKRELPGHEELCETTYRRLGAPTELKALQVERLRTALLTCAFPSDFGQRRWKRLQASLENLTKQIEPHLGGEKDRLKKLIDRNSPCHHSFFRHIDHQIAHIGAGRKVSLPGEGEERKRIHEAVTHYAHALGSWLSRRSPDQAISIWPASREVVARVYEMLGEATPRKRWLAACLWKKLLDNQAKHGRGALDEQPDRFALPGDALTA